MNYITYAKMPCQLLLSIYFGSYLEAHIKAVSMESNEIEGPLYNLQYTTAI